ncbi:COP23 domain-containing protein [Synechocystis sp. PCC 7509]|uniref:COP23 domain-containing protein n=1 Tax=Synechocystis sp. PCC 7509 TaxID=927677 RepID=UPI0002AC5487|nr:COP23 domain-containing protein [Synechocystis sp. PCC 7509]
MKTIWSIPILTAALSLSATLPLLAQGANQGEKTIFECVKEQSSGNIATIAKRGNRTSTPLIVWTATLNSDANGGLYTPERRCNAVAKRLTNLVSTLGQGSLRNLLLDYKPVNKEVAICVYHTAQAQCTTDNVVFTLKPENRVIASQILASLKEFSEKGSGSPIFESEDDANIAPTQAVSLEAWSERAFKAN